jgi:hypothetical protein
MKAHTFSPRDKLEVFAVLLALAACIPFPSLTVPEWRVQFVDRKGRPFTGLKVGQTWQNYSTEIRDHKESRRTDAQGCVSFPRRTNWAPLAVRILGPVASFFFGGWWEAAYGPSSWLTTSCNVSEVYDGAVYNGSSTLQNQVTLKYYDRSGPRAIFGDPPILPECASIEAQAKDADIALR